MNKYERYKKVDLPWLEEVPEHWEVKRNKSIFKEKKEVVGERFIDYKLLSLTLRGVIERNLDGGGKFPASFEKYVVVKSNDFVFCLFDMDETPRTIGLSLREGMITGAYTIFEAYTNYSSQFLNYFYLYIDSIKGLKPYYSGLRKTVNMDKFNSIKIPIPPLDEQEKIAAFLDWKINEIDRLIAVEKEKIEKLNRLFEKIISFNSSNMQEESIRKYVDIVRGNSTFTKDDLLSKGTYVALQYGKVYKVDTIDNNYNFYVNDEFYKSSQIVDRNDIIAVYTSETIEDLGHFAFYDRDEKGLIGGEQLLIKPKEGIDPKYLFYCLKKDALSLKKASTGIKVYRFKSNDLKSIKIPVVSLNEQKKIVERIEKKLSIIKRNINICNSIIGELNSFKYSLISEVVTGKIDVRNVVIPSYEKVDIDISTDEEKIKE
ncbi:restriction endonuclease subunit S [Streptococcus mitis]|uniref:restriction endonuclease subunit S n=1 Tax=Streptococcus mitis TaxID=28037 RepID=UPI0021B6A09D|nr:restriction endonuclease subunit S [Streptococcus mitis]